jgi:hypothetical protein
MRCTRCKEPISRDELGWYTQVPVTSEEAPGLTFMDRAHAHEDGTPHEATRPAPFQAKPAAPETVEAWQFSGDEIAEDIAEWCEGTSYWGKSHGHTSPPWSYHTCVTPAETIDGGKGHADPGDWIVRLADYLYEVLSPEEFAEKYEAEG